MFPLHIIGPGWLNELGSWITQQLIQAYHQYGVDSRPALQITKRFTRLAAASDKVYQLLAHGRWFSPGTPASFTTNTGRHDIAEILKITNVLFNTEWFCHAVSYIWTFARTWMNFNPKVRQHGCIQLVAILRTRTENPPKL